MFQILNAEMNEWEKFENENIEMLNHLFVYTLSGTIALTLDLIPLSVVK